MECYLCLEPAFFASFRVIRGQLSLFNLRQWAHPRRYGATHLRESILGQQGRDRRTKAAPTLAAPIRWSLGFGAWDFRRRAAVVLGAGLEPASLSAYAPQTYVSAIPPPERDESKLEDGR